MDTKDRIIVRQNVLSHATAIFIAGKSDSVLKTAELMEKWVWRDIDVPAQAAAPKPMTAPAATTAGQPEMVCSRCGKRLSEKVAEYSVNLYKMPLCMEHQKGVKR